MNDDNASLKTVLILLNDVDPLLNKVTKNKLMKELGWDCIVVVDYEDAIKTFKSKTADAVITEILILDDKNRDGIDLVSEMRAIEQPNDKKIPIIVFSELDDDNYQKKALEKGATAFFSKNSVSLNNFIAEIAQYVN